jgi:3-oxoacyl-[acyl-carrier protein] reductase
MDLGIDGRVALVAASSKGLGLASAEALAAEGARVVICGRGAESLAAARARIAASGAEVEAVQIDVTEPDAPAHLVARALERFGSLEIVVPNAGGPPSGGALEVTPEAIAAAVNANLLASVRLVLEALPSMRASGWGRICCISSYSVVQAVPTLALSNTARAGLRAWAKTAAADLSGTGITLNLACPGLHATERLTGLGVQDSPLGDPADFGHGVAVRCSQPAGFVTGATVVVDGGATLAL